MSSLHALPVVLARLATLPAAQAADAARADQDARWRAGERPPAEAYLTGLPAVAADPDQAMVLIYGEVLARAARGETPTDGEYAGRFPHLAERIAVQFAVHAALHPNSDLPTGTPTVGSGDPAVTHSGPPADPPAAVPEAVGPYRILGELGRGGMGLVYAARDPSLDREVAVKTLFPGRPARPDAAARFVREAFITAKLPHPGIPPVYALGEQPDRTPYLAMKLIRGHTLEHLLRARPHPAADLPRFVGVFEQVCQAVGFAHSQAVVHRDLKPSNVMVGAFGEVQVMDWGLAKDLTGGAVESPAADAEASGLIIPTTGDDRTQPGSILGTPAYMAPEQARSEPADPRADVFALGGLLCAILTGQPTFVAPDARATWRLAVAANTADALARLAGCGADPDLIALAKRCLSATPAERPADAGEVAKLVAEHRAGVEERLRRSETEQAAAEARETEGKRKRRWQRVAAAVVALLVAGGGAFAWWQDKVDRDRKADVARVEGEKAIELARIEGERQADELRRQAKEAASAARNIQALESLTGQLKAALGVGDTERTADLLADADKRASEPGGEKFRDLLARCRTDFDMLRVIDDLDAEYWNPVGEMWKLPEKFARALDAFGRYGIRYGETSTDEVARIVNGSLIREPLLCAMSRGYSLLTDEKYTTRLGGPIIAGLLTEKYAEYLSAIDPDPFSNRVRTAMLHGERVKLLDLICQPEESAQEPHFVHMIACTPLAELEVRHKFLLDAFRSRSSDFRLLFGLGTFSSNPTEKAGWLRAAIAVRPKNARAWNGLGRALQDTGDWDGAVAAHREAVRLARGYASCHTDLAYVLHRKGHFDEAITSCREALLIDPNHARACYNLGRALRDKGQFDEAVAAYKKVLKLNQNYPYAHYHLGIVYEDQREPDLAIEAYRTETRNDPRHLDAFYRLGKLLRRKGELGEALTALRKAAEIAPKNETIKGELKAVENDKAARDRKPAPRPEVLPPPRPADKK